MCFFKTCVRLIVSIALVLGLSSQSVNAKPVVEPVIIAAKVSLNEANAPSIANRVPGIGIKRAEAIVAYRKTHGKFNTFNDLAKVKGISERYITKNIDKLREAFSL